MRMQCYRSFLINPLSEQSHAGIIPEGGLFCQICSQRSEHIVSEGEFPLDAQNLALYKFYFQSTWDGTSGIIPLGDYYIVKTLVQNGKN